jgi:hypothetical protein
MAGTEIIEEAIHHRIAENKFETNKEYTPARLAALRNGRSPMLARIAAAVSMNPARRPTIDADVVNTSFISRGTSIRPWIMGTKKITPIVQPST